MRCSCGNPNCKSVISISSGDSMIDIWTTDRFGSDNLMYLSLSAAKDFVNLLNTHIRLLEIKKNANEDIHNL